MYTPHFETIPVCVGERMMNMRTGESIVVTGNNPAQWEPSEINYCARCFSQDFREEVEPDYDDDIYHQVCNVCGAVDQTHHAPAMSFNGPILSVVRNY